MISGSSHPHKENCITTSTQNDEREMLNKDQNLTQTTNCTICQSTVLLCPRADKAYGPQHVVLWYLRQWTWAWVCGQLAPDASTLMPHQHLTWCGELSRLNLGAVELGTFFLPTAVLLLIRCFIQIKFSSVAGEAIVHLILTAAMVFSVRQLSLNNLNYQTSNVSNRGNNL